MTRSRPFNRYLPCALVVIALATTPAFAGDATQMREGAYESGEGQDPTTRHRHDVKQPGSETMMEGAGARHRHDMKQPGMSAEMKKTEETGSRATQP